jgi:hypothetical protein
MSEPPRRQLRDVERRRRDYVVKKPWFGVTALFLISICSGFGLCGAYLAYSIFFSSQGADLPWTLPAYLLAIPAAFVLGGAFVARHCVKKATAIPYVPPVREQLAWLPADEVLLRGSDEPAATADELLRAAAHATETPAEELLRATER